MKRNVEAFKKYYANATKEEVIEDITEYISVTVDNLDKIIQYLQAYQERSREQDIAMQKLEEAVFWLTYGIEESDDNA